MICTYDPCLTAKCCHEWRFLSAIKNPREFVLTVPFLCMCEWAGQVDYYLWLGKSSPDAKNCDLISRMALEALYLMGPEVTIHPSCKGKQGFFLGVKGNKTEKEPTETKHEGSRYVWSHQSSSRKDHVLFLPTRWSGFVSNCNEGGHQATLDPKHLH